MTLSKQNTIKGVCVCVPVFAEKVLFLLIVESQQIKRINIYANKSNG